MLKRSEFEQLMEEWHEATVALSARKGNDYAGDEDVLANFRRMHEMCAVLELQPGKYITDVYLFYMLVKLDRLANLIHRGAEPGNESLLDTVQDMTVYMNLLRAQLVELEQEAFDA